MNSSQKAILTRTYNFYLQIYDRLPVDERHLIEDELKQAQQAIQLNNVSKARDDIITIYEVCDEHNWIDANQIVYPGPCGLETLVA